MENIVVEERATKAEARAPRTATFPRLDLWCERTILGLVLAILVYAPLATGAVRPQDFLIVQWLALATLAVWALRFCINPAHRLLWPPMCWPVLLFMSYAVARYVTADIEYIARQEMIKVLIYGFLFFAILNNLHRTESTTIIGATVIFIGMAIAVYGIYQFVSESNNVWHFVRPALYAKRASGTFICPNNMAGYLEMLLPLALTYALTGRFSHVSRILLGYAAVVIFIGIGLSVSRGGWASIIVALACLIVMLFRKSGYRLQAFALLVAIVGAGALFFMKADLSANRRDRMKLENQVQDTRTLLWKPALKMWQDYPLWGMGPAHFDHRFRQYRPENPYVQARPDRVHNDYLNTLVDWGVAGTTLVAAAWVLFFWGVGRSWKYVQRAQADFGSKPSNRSAFVLGGTLGLVAILVHSTCDFNMHIPANAILAVTLLALVAGHFRFATEGHWRTVRWPLRIPVMLVLLAGLGYLGRQTWQRTQESRWLVQAQNAKHYSEARVIALERAFAVDSKNHETAYDLGEDLRLQSWRGAPGYQLLALRAMGWFERGMALNPYDPYPPLRYGMCLHWLDRHGEAQPYFDKALRLDPNSYYARAHMGWHYAQLGEWQHVKDWMIRSLYMKGDAQNTIAWQYLSMAEKRLKEDAGSK
jgi:O-antigen ligase